MSMSHGRTASALAMLAFVPAHIAPAISSRQNDEIAMIKREQELQLRPQIASGRGKGGKHRPQARISFLGSKKVRISWRHHPHQGSCECARRIRQMGGVAPESKPRRLWVVHFSDGAGASSIAFSKYPAPGLLRTIARICAKHRVSYSVRLGEA